VSWRKCGDVSDCADDCARIQEHQSDNPRFNYFEKKKQAMLHKWLLPKYRSKLYQRILTKMGVDLEKTEITAIKSTQNSNFKSIEDQVYDRTTTAMTDNHDLDTEIQLVSICSDPHHDGLITSKDGACPDSGCHNPIKIYPVIWRLIASLDYIMSEIHNAKVFFGDPICSGYVSAHLCSHSSHARKAVIGFRSGADCDDRCPATQSHLNDKKSREARQKTLGSQIRKLSSKKIVDELAVSSLEMELKDSLDDTSDDVIQSTIVAYRVNPFYVDPADSMAVMKSRGLPIQGNKFDYSTSEGVGLHCYDPHHCNIIETLVHKKWEYDKENNAYEVLVVPNPSMCAWKKQHNVTVEYPIENVGHIINSNYKPGKWLLKKTVGLTLSIFTPVPLIGTAWGVVFDMSTRGKGIEMIGHLRNEASLRRKSVVDVLRVHFDKITLIKEFGPTPNLIAQTMSSDEVNEEIVASGVSFSDLKKMTGGQSDDATTDVAALAI
jgi:hypothetical protein